MSAPRGPSHLLTRYMTPYQRQAWWRELAGNAGGRPKMTGPSQHELEIERWAEVRRVLIRGER